MTLIALAMEFGGEFYAQVPQLSLDPKCGFSPSPCLHFNGINSLHLVLGMNEESGEGSKCG